MKKALVIGMAFLLAASVAAQSFTPQQQEQFAKCTAAAQKVQAETRTLLDLAQGPQFSTEKLKAQVPKVQQAYQAMHEQHKVLMEPLEGAPVKAVETRKKMMDQACMRIRASLKQLELIAATASPDARKVAQHAETIAAAMNEWQKEHQAIGRDMGVK